MPSYTAVSTFVPDVSLRAKLPQLALDRIRGDYGAVVGERFMVGLNEAQFVEVVDQEPGGLAHALSRSVAEKVQPLQASAVAEMESGKRVERLAAAFRTQGVEGRKAEEDRAQPLSCGRVLVPVRSAQECQGVRINPLKPRCGRVVSDPFQPGAETRGWRQRHEGFQRGKVTGEILVFSAGRSRERSSTTCLIRKLPKETPRKPGWQLLI